MTDPLAALRGDIDELRNMHPLERARQRGEAAEAAENRRSELARQERQEQIANDLAQMEMRERAEIAQQGFTTRELRHLEAERRDAAAEKIALLEQELGRLDPARAAVKRGETQRAAQAAEDARLLAEFRRQAEDPFMAGELARFHRSRGPEVSRSRPFDVITRSEQCLWCIEQNVSDEEAVLLHHDPELAVPVTPPGQQPEPAQQSEVDRLTALGYSAGTARLATVPYRTGTGWPEINR
jgi:hypothetical protein